MPHSIYIKNMVCNRCIMVVENILMEINISPLSVKLGELTLTHELDDEQKGVLANRLQAVGFELIDNKKNRLIEQVKNLIIKLIYEENNKLRMNLSDHISENTHYDYTYISNLFSEITGTTIEKYYIAQKIERVKELLVYDELSLSEIADLLGYSSTAHLSAQFKKVTGLTPGYFKQIKENKRKPIDQV